MDLDSKIYVPGHTGLVGSAVLRLLREKGYSNIIISTRNKLDLTRQHEVEQWFGTNKPEYVILCAARVGGIAANQAEPAQFYYDNIMIANNVIHSSFKTGVKKLLYLGSSCIYPRHAHQPMREEYILTGQLEPTNEAYAIAKIAGLKMCQYYKSQYEFNSIAIIPPNLYGPGDNFDPYRSHVIAALINKFHNAKVNNLDSVKLWGSGNARREFMYVEDLAEIIIYLMNNYDSNQFLNVGTGVDYSIKELAKIISNIIGFKGKVEFDTSMPDGMPQKLMDSSKFMSLGWRKITPLEKGIEYTYQWYLKNIVK